MTWRGDEDDEAIGRACLLIIGIAAVSISFGYIWGAGAGWLTLGFACLSIVVASVYLASRKP